VRVAGVMSGTSLDGIDVAIVEIRGRRIETIGFQSMAYAEPLRRAILEAASAEAISRLNFQLGELYARAVLRAVRRFGPVELIGCHGQTIYHEGGAHTLQIGEPAVIAERAGVPVVSNFRTRDVAAGGQGAPLVPYVDYLLFRDAKRTRIALNIGGIANITVMPPSARPQDVLAFDTGPGNMVIDALAREYTGGREHFDRDGAIAASGTIDRGLLKELLADSYYRRRPPKSAGREQYGASFVERMKKSKRPLPDLIATATALTAATIARGVNATAPSGRGSVSAHDGSHSDDARALLSRDRRELGAGDLIVSGGGVHNRQLMAQIVAFLPDMAVTTSAQYGVDPDAKEAIAFGVLAYETWRRKPANLPSATGATRAVILGNITP
jgi:anhydro-N-acetylmuramic acid kinase